MFRSSCLPTLCTEFLLRPDEQLVLAPPRGQRYPDAGAGTNSPELGWRPITDAGLELDALKGCWDERQASWGVWWVTETQLLSGLHLRVDCRFSQELFPYRGVIRKFSVVCGLSQGKWVLSARCRNSHSRGTDVAQMKLFSL